MTNFETLGLSKPLLRAVEAEGYTTVEEHLPDRIKSIREAVNQITTQLDNND